MKSIPHRRLQDIRTMSERISAVDNPQKKYLTLAMLEIEKVRRNKEKQSANQRVANIDQRMVEIVAEQANLLAVAQADLDALAPAKQSGRPAGSDSQSGCGFKLAY
jgi:hypothetical protein